MLKQLKHELDGLDREYLERLDEECSRIKKMTNRQLRKYIENSNWNNILQIIRFLQDESNILAEFEHWLEEELKQKQNSLQFYEGREPREIIKLEKEIPILKVILDKLQELKEGKK